MRRRLRTLVGSGRFWTAFWCFWLAVWSLAMIPTLTVWAGNLRWTNFMSDAALILASAGCAQSSLTMRKADPDDPL